MYLTKVSVHSGDYPTKRCYPFSILVLREPFELTLRRPVVFFVGENGSGKSTLLEAITRKCGIHIWDRPKRHVAHNNPYEDRLADYVSLTWTNGRVPGSLFRAETFRDLADFLDDVALCDPGRLKYHGGRIINTLSHGQGRFLNLLQRLEGTDHAQFIIATHSPILLAYPGAQILSFDSSPIKEVAYEQTTHYKLYEAFFSDRSVFLQDPHLPTPQPSERRELSRDDNKVVRTGFPN